jgi:hypothetical protein
VTRSSSPPPPGSRLSIVHASTQSSPTPPLASLSSCCCLGTGSHSSIDSKLCLEILAIPRTAIKGTLSKEELAGTNSKAAEYYSKVGSYWIGSMVLMAMAKAMATAPNSSLTASSARESAISEASVPLQVYQVIPLAP